MNISDTITMNGEVVGYVDENGQLHFLKESPNTSKKKQPKTPSLNHNTNEKYSWAKDKASNKHKTIVKIWLSSADANASRVLRDARKNSLFKDGLSYESVRAVLIQYPKFNELWYDGTNARNKNKKAVR